MKKIYFGIIITLILFYFFVDSKPLDIQATAPPIGTSAKLESSGLKKHCEDKFHVSKSDTWAANSNHFSVGEVYGNTPIDQTPFNTVLSTARGDLMIGHYGGCGPVAFYSQMDFLARYANYPKIADINKFDSQVTLAKEIYYNTPLYDVGNDPVTGNKLIFTWPSHLVKTAYSIMENRNLFDQFNIHQIGNLYSKNVKIAKIKESIDRGMPVILWTLGDGWGDYRDHYMNIFAYEEWTGPDLNGDIQTCTFFELRKNWGYANSVFLDSDALSGTSGLVLFEELYDNISAQPAEYGFPQEYNFVETSPNITAHASSYLNSNLSFNLSTKRLRAGYILGEYLTLSAKRDGAGTAYVEYDFNDVPIYGLNMDLSLWGGFEEISIANSTIRLEYKDSFENWIVAKDFFISPLSTNKDSPKNYSIYFDVPAYIIRICVNMTNTYDMGNENKGRVVIGNLNLPLI